MNDAAQSRPGFYRDAAGNWQVDRRSTERRDGQSGGAWTHECRCLFRRQADRELYEKDHKRMIDEALTDFAEEHEGHV